MLGFGCVQRMGLAAVPEFIERSARNRSPIELLKMKLSTKAD